MKYLKYFKTDADYQQYESEGILTPNVSFVEEPTSVFYNPYVESASAANLCDIAYWDGSKVKTVSQDKWNSGLGTPVGVVVIPSGFAPDGKARMIGLKYATSAGTSSDSGVDLAWGPQGTDTSLTNYIKVPTTDNAGSTSTGSVDYAYLPSDMFTGKVSYVDPGTQYADTEIISRRMIPSPYITRDGKYEVNPEYYKEIVGNNVLSDFNGASNTAVLVGLGADYTAANAAHNYNGGVTGTDIQWYLPAAGELGFIMPRFNAINAAIQLVGGVAVDGVYDFWSSSEYSSDYAYTVYTKLGLVNNDDKIFTYYVRAFACL